MFGYYNFIGNDGDEGLSWLSDDDTSDNKIITSITNGIIEAWGARNLKIIDPESHFDALLRYAVEELKSRYNPSTIILDKDLEGYVYMPWGYIKAELHKITAGTSGDLSNITNRIDGLEEDLRKAEKEIDGVPDTIIQTIPLFELSDLGERINNLIIEMKGYFDEKLNEESQARGTAIGQVDSKIDTETQARIDAIGDVNSRIDAEVQARGTAIGEVNSRIESEVQARGEAITVLENSIPDRIENKLNIDHQAGRNASGTTVQKLMQDIWEITQDLSTANTNLNDNIVEKLWVDYDLGASPSANNAIQRLRSDIDNARQTEITSINSSITTINIRLEAIRTWIRSNDGGSSPSWDWPS